MGARAEHVGQEIRLLRGRRGLTQEELAERAGLSPTTLVHLENGDVRAPRIGTLYSLAKALQVDPELLIGEAFVRRLTRLKELRERASLSQADLAKRAGVLKKTIAHLEGLHRYAQPSTARKIASALGVGVEELYEDRERLSGKPFTAVYRRSEQGWWLASCPEIPGAVTQGLDLEEAREMLKNVTRSLMETRRDTELRQIEDDEDAVWETLGVHDE
jgi:transcriptional regulator with XRE-family HTH domain